MKLIAMCILIFSSLQLAFAMELFIPEQSEVDKNDSLNEEECKIDLRITVDNNCKIYIFRISPQLLQDSPYFRARLKYYDGEELELHLKSITVFFKLIFSLHGRPLHLDYKVELLEAMVLQEKFQFNSLNEKLLSFIKKERDLNSLHASELTYILKYMDKSLFWFGNACTKQILDYIRDYHNINKNCSRSEIFKYLSNHPYLRDLIDQNIKQVNDQMALGEKMIENELSALGKRYQKKLFKIANKIMDDIHENGRVVNRLFKVSSSINKTKNVIKILNLKYRIDSEFYDERAGKESKYKIIIKGFVPINTNHLFENCPSTI